MVEINFTNKSFKRKCHCKPRELTLLQATGIAKRHNLMILDTCAGRGQDAALMAAFGARVLAYERHEGIYQALIRAHQTVAKYASWANQLHFKHQDAISVLQVLNEAQYPDVIYIDPMYPHLSKNPRNKLILQQMRELVGNDDDADQLLLSAWGKANERIVVKRPKKAPVLANLPPSYQ